MCDLAKSTSEHNERSDALVRAGFPGGKYPSMFVFTVFQTTKSASIKTPRLCGSDSLPTPPDSRRIVAKSVLFQTEVLRRVFRA